MKIEASDYTYYRRRKYYSSIRADQAKRLKDMKIENYRLETLVADFSLDNAC
jgi:hypothetical protein